MKKRTATGTGLKSWLAVLSGVAVLAGVFTPLDEAAAQIATTRHNLGSGTAAGNNKFSGTDEICVFCHTPHGAASGAGNPPLWNKALPAGPYQIYNTSVSTTIDAATAQDGITGSIAIGSVSIACLSCHDGTQAMNNMINQPGSGGYNAAGASMAGVWTAGTGASPVDTATGKLASTGVADLTADLRNDHPIGIQYCGGGYNTGAGAGPCGDSDFNAPTSTTIAGTKVFWVETGGNGTRNKTDLILYNRSFGGASTEPSVECATCHDPHSATNPTFLRKSNAASGVCLTCHVK